MITLKSGVKIGMRGEMKGTRTIMGRSWQTIIDAMNKGNLDGGLSENEKIVGVEIDPTYGLMFRLEPKA